MEYYNNTLRPTKFLVQQPTETVPVGNARKEPFVYNTQTNFEEYQNKRGVLERVSYKSILPSGEEYNINTKMYTNVYPPIGDFIANERKPAYKPVPNGSISNFREPTGVLNPWMSITHKENVSYGDDRISIDTRANSRETIG